MDVAYDHIQEEVLAPKEVVEGGQNPHRSPSNDLNNEVREVYKALSTSPWGSTLGGFLGSVKKQARRTPKQHPRLPIPHQIHQGLSLPILPLNPFQADIVKEAENILSRFRSEAAARLQLVQKAEDAADEALLKFGTNIRNFLREAVTIAPPSDNDYEGSRNTLLFESKDAEGKRVVHATRFDAQLHVLHTTPSSFTKDPPSDGYEEWKRDFDVEQKTGDIATDMDKFEELRRAMEKLVPENVQYTDFWTRYYFLRHVIETDERKRRELLMGTQAEEEEVGWGDDEEEEEQATTPTTATMQLNSESQVADSEISISKEPGDAKESGDAKVSGDAKESDDAKELSDAKELDTSKEYGNATEPIKAKEPGDAKEVHSAEFLKQGEPRKSNEQSVADSDASYDILSGTNTRGSGSPKESIEKKRASTVAEHSDEEDWE